MATFNRPISMPYLWMFLLAVNSTYAAICQTSTPGLFVTHPFDQTVKESENATFICSAENVHQEHFDLFWEVHPDIYHRETITNLVRDQLIITSRTTVYRIGKTEQNFRCLLKYSVAYPEVCYHSRIATTKVHFFPKNNQLSCGPDLTHGLREGETIALRCAAPRGNPPVDLHWTFDTYSGTDVALPILSERGLLRIITMNLDVTRDMHLKNISCQVTSEFAFPGEITSCTLGPILVFQKPHVIVYPAQATTESTNLVPLRFQCIAKGFPEDFAYSWSCLPENSMCKYEHYTNILYVTAASSENTVTTDIIRITCTVSNSIGVSHNVSNMKTLQPRHNYDICNESLPNDTQLIRLDLEERKVEYSLHFRCMLHALVSTYDVNFTWYINGKFLLSISKKIDGALGPLINVSIDGGSELEKGTVIFCKVSGTVGVNYVTITTCTIVRGNGLTTFPTLTREPGLYGNISLFSLHKLHRPNSDSKLQAITKQHIPAIHNSTDIHDQISYTNDLHSEGQELDTSNDISKEPILNIATDITGKTEGPFYFWHGNALILSISVILMFAAILTLFIVRNRLKSRHINAATLDTTGLPEESGDIYSIDPSYEVPNVQSTSDEDISLHCSNSIHSDSLCSVYAEGYDGQGTASSSPYSSSVCSCELNENYEL